MAELPITTPTSKKRLNSHAAKPDMTPMVDLGFLLITFFMFTTTFSVPNVMKLNMPEQLDGNLPPPLKSKNTITIILDENDSIYWYQKDLQSVLSSDLHITDYSPTGIREKIIELRNAAPKPERFTVIIKPTDKSNYKNVVDVLDEMEITQSERYVIAEINIKEEAALANKTLKTQLINN